METGGHGLFLLSDGFMVMGDTRPSAPHPAGGVKRISVLGKRGQEPFSNAGSKLPEVSPAKGLFPNRVIRKRLLTPFPSAPRPVGQEEVVEGVDHQGVGDLLPGDHVRDIVQGGRD